MRSSTLVAAPTVISSLRKEILDRTWTRTGGDFKAELERFGVEVVEYNMLEHPKLVKKT